MAVKMYVKERTRRCTVTDYLTRIVVGAVNSSLRDVFTKLAKLQAKQGFAFAIVLGDLFGDCSTEDCLNELVALIEGTIQVPLPTYFTVGKKDLPLRVIEKLEEGNE
ncbi:hypothetical protein KEM54_004387, partial [Ascosphaera aggregata]